MVRPVDPQIRVELLERVLTYVLAHGVADLSLRPLAHAIGSSPRTLLYHFQSRENLLCVLFESLREAAFSDVRRCLDSECELKAGLVALWRWMSAPQQRGTLKLFHEMFGISLREPERFGGYALKVSRSWFEFMRQRLVASGRSNQTASYIASLLTSMFNGATLELCATGDLSRLTIMIEQFLEQNLTEVDEQAFATGRKRGMRRLKAV